MYTVLLGVVLSSTGAQAPAFVGYPGYGYGCYCAPYYPVAYPVAVVSSKSDAEKTIQNLRKRLKALEEKFEETEPQVRMTRDALLQLAGKVEKIDENIKTKEPQFLQALKDVNDRVKGLEDYTKPAIGKLSRRVKTVEDTLKKQDEDRKAAEVQALKDRVKEVEANLQKQDEDKKAAEVQGLKDRVKELEDQRKGPLPPPPGATGPGGAAPGQTGTLISSLDHFIDRLKKVEVEMRDDSKVEAMVDRLGRVEGALNAEQQKMQSAIDALRAVSENTEKGFLNVNARLRLLEERFVPATKGLQQPPQTEPEPKKAEEQPKQEDGFGWAPPTPTAMLIINVPANATLYLNGQVTKATGAARAFVTPTLQTGKQYSYQVRADYVRNGQRVSESRSVTFQAGNRIAVAFDGQGGPTVTVRAQ